MDLRVGLRSTCRCRDRPTRFHRLRQRRAYTRRFCGVQVSPCVRPIVAGSSTCLVTSLYPVDHIAGSRHVIPAPDLARQRDVKNKCAWRMARRIGLFMVETDVESLLGEVQAQRSWLLGVVVRFHVVSPPGAAPCAQASPSWVSAARWLPSQRRPSLGITTKAPSTRSPPLANRSPPLYWLAVCR